MTFLIVAEGQHELGGALETLIRRLVAHEQIEFHQKNVRDRDLRSNPGTGDGFFKKAIRSMLFAEENGFDALVFLIDADGDRDRRRQVAAAQGDARFAIPRAMGVAVERSSGRVRGNTDDSGGNDSAVGG